MKSQNFPILLILIGLVAVLAYFNQRQAPPSGSQPVQRDLEVCLQQLWERPGQQVTLTPGPDGQYRLQASVDMPRATRQRQQRWNYPFLRFALGRHPKTVVASIEVNESSSRALIPETAMNGLLADRIAPRAEGGNEEAASTMTARRLNMALEGMVGPGQGLVLVDALSTSSQTGEVRYGKRAASFDALPGAFDYVVWVVTHRAVPEADWGGFQNRYLVGVRNTRRVVLP